MRICDKCRIGTLITYMLSLMLLLGWLPTASAMPDFARKYNMSCSACHAAYPRLNEFGEHFVDNNLKLPNWKDGTVPAGDDMLALPSTPSLAVRAQAFVQSREAESIDPISGETQSASTDFQSPYLVKLLSSAPLSEHITYYFYAILAEKGGNGETVVEDAWFRHDDIFASGIGMQLGQFQISDLMFPREIRLSFQDFMIYRMAGITYERGVLFDYGLGDFDLALGFVNGNGIEENFDLNSPGYKRPDKMFDNDTSKTAFGRIGTDIGPVAIGLFGLAGQQKNATGDAGLEHGDRDTDKAIVGLDLSGKAGDKTYWFAQALFNTWSDFLLEGQDYEWHGAFIGVDYIHSDRWVYSALLNYADANDLDNSDTIYEGIDIETLALTVSYYFMRNMKGIVEVNFDLLDVETMSGTYYTGHLSGEDYLLLGFDAAF